MSKHTDQSLPGPTQAESRYIHNALSALLATLLREMPRVDRDAIAFELAAAAWRLTGDRPRTDTPAEVRPESGRDDQEVVGP